ncbi:hypothetical protein B0H17DRAFT_1150198 [Mycena rosella]|uniref:Uncharacterized protein n=1 Tax=Mycena rosella TaxID=1033263 RepID=A0AAD7BVI3_MYCRO|nr:hypothetical protein B0H17DRAFT_1150198 [Mycena rosella]
MPYGWGCLPLTLRARRSPAILPVAMPLIYEPGTNVGRLGGARWYICAPYSLADFCSPPVSLGNPVLRSVLRHPPRQGFSHHRRQPKALFVRPRSCLQFSARYEDETNGVCPGYAPYRLRISGISSSLPPLNLQRSRSTSRAWRVIYAVRSGADDWCSLLVKFGMRNDTQHPSASPRVPDVHYLTSPAGPMSPAPMHYPDIFTSLLFKLPPHTVPPFPGPSSSIRPALTRLNRSRPHLVRASCPTGCLALNSGLRADVFLIQKRKLSSARGGSSSYNGIVLWQSPPVRLGARPLTNDICFCFSSLSGRINPADTLPNDALVAALANQPMLERRRIVHLLRSFSGDSILFATELERDSVAHAYGGSQATLGLPIAGFNLGPSHTKVRPFTSGPSLVSYGLTLFGALWGKINGVIPLAFRIPGTGIWEGGQVAQAATTCRYSGPSHGQFFIVRTGSKCFIQSDPLCLLSGNVNKGIGRGVPRTTEPGPPRLHVELCTRLSLGKGLNFGEVGLTVGGSDYRRRLGRRCSGRLFQREDIWRRPESNGRTRISALPAVIVSQSKIVRIRVFRSRGKKLPDPKAIGAFRAQQEMHSAHHWVLPGPRDILAG